MHHKNHCTSSHHFQHLFWKWLIPLYLAACERVFIITTQTSTYLENNASTDSQQKVQVQGLSGAGIILCAEERLIYRDDNTYESFMKKVRIRVDIVYFIHIQYHLQKHVLMV